MKKLLETDQDVIVQNGIVHGAKVIIKSGSFEGVRGTVIEGEAVKSISVSIDLLNRSIIAHLPDDSSLEIVREFSS